MPNEGFNNANLREVLVDSIRRVQRGEMSPGQGNSIAALAGQILKSARLDLEASEKASLQGGLAANPVGLLPGTFSGIESTLQQVHDFITEHGSKPLGVLAKAAGFTVDELTEVVSSHPWFVVEKDKLYPKLTGIEGETENGTDTKPQKGSSGRTSSAANKRPAKAVKK